MTNNDIEQRVDEILTTFGLHSIAAFRVKGAAIRQHDEAKQAILSLLTDAETRGRLNEWELVGETLHRANIAAELHIHKVIEISGRVS